MNDPTPLEAIFFAALEQPPAQREEFLDRACGGDQDLRRRVEKMLEAKAPAESFLETPHSAVEVASESTIDQPHSDRVGSQVGPYKLLEKIGEGGMGVVYMAEQSAPVKRRVALKVIKPGMDTGQVIARFEAERQALSLMDHPNIARVLDAGTTQSGRPYFVMELVKGQPITQYCDEHQLTPRQRLELLLPVFQAIQHAHQKGIIHRDIKPSNILVAEYDQQPVPKVIDFGVAKAVSQPLTEKTMFTGFGQILGTLEYMSPEQAKVNQLDIDTRSDIYSLGVLLYELLTGTTPFDTKRLRSAAWDEMLRIIREEEPPKPSTRLSESKLSLPAISAQRHTEPAKLAKLVRGELDWIVMKALEKDRGRRYETANSFALDVQRYLADEPVLAGPPSTVYRLRKFVRRNRAAVLAVSLVLLALVGGIIGTSWGLLLARHAQKAEAANAEGRRQAVIAAQKAIVNERIQREIALIRAEEAQRNFLKAREAVKLILTMLPDYGDDGFVLMIYSNSDDVEFVQGTFGTTYSTMGQDVKKQLIEKAIQYYEGFLQEDGLDPELRLEVATAYLYRAAITEQRGGKDVGKNEPAEAAYRHSLAILTKLAEEAPRRPEVRRLLARGSERLAYLLTKTLRTGEADKLYAQAIEVQNGLVREFPGEAKYRSDRAATQFSWGTYLRRGQRLEEAKTAYRQSQRDFEEYIGFYTDGRNKDVRPFDRNRRFYIGYVCRSLGNLLVEMKQPAEAEAAYRQALLNFARPPDKPDLPASDDELARTHLRLGRLLEQAGRAKEAEQEFRAALADYEQLVKSDRDGRYVDDYADLQCDCADAAKDHATVARIVQEAPGVPKKGRNQLQSYNAACRMARCIGLAQNDAQLTADRRDELIKQYTTDAMKLLSEAIQKGFTDAEHIQQDKDLDPLRSREDFQKLVKELEQKAKPTAIPP